MYRVLIADDEAIERKALCRKLQKYFGDSCEVSQAENGLEAVSLFQEAKIQIVIMDIGMPGMNGIEAAEQIRRMDRECSIIFLTAYDDFCYTRQAIIIRALDYLLKPCEDDDLTAVMEEAMRLADQRKSVQTDTDPGMGKALLSDEEGQCSLQEEAEDVGGQRLSQMALAIREYIRDNYMKDISMQTAARAMNYSDVYFCKLFKQCFDQNFTAYLTQFRVNEAKKLLVNPTANVKDVSICVGYADSNYFSKVFKRLTGVVPSEYRYGNLAQK